MRKELNGSRSYKGKLWEKVRRKHDLLGVMLSKESVRHPSGNVFILYSEEKVTTRRDICVRCTSSDLIFQATGGYFYMKNVYLVANNCGEIAIVFSWAEGTGNPKFGLFILCSEDLLSGTVSLQKGIESGIQQEGKTGRCRYEFRE